MEMRDERSFCCFRFRKEERKKWVRVSSVIRENGMSIFVYHMVFLIAETVPERTLVLFPYLQVVEFVCLKDFINSWVKTYRCFNLSHMSHYFIALLEFFLSNLVFSFSVNRKYLEEPCVWVESNTTTLSILSSHAEIGLGFLLIISLFSWDSQRYFFLFQSLWIFISFLSDSNILYLQVAAQHNTNFHVLAGSLLFSFLPLH